MKRNNGSKDGGAIPKVRHQSRTRSMESDFSTTTAYYTSNSSHQQSGVSGLTSSDNRPKKLTIECQTKIDAELSKKRFLRHRPSKRVVAIKWISTFVLASLLLAFVTQSKISAIAISENMQRLTSEPGPETVQAACRMFVILFLIVLIPNGVNFLRGVWGGLFRKDIPWPCKRSFFVGFFICAIETFGTCIFVMKIPSMTHPYMVILLANCVFVVPVGVALYKAMFGTATQSRKKSMFFGIALVLELTGIGLTVTLWIVSKHSTDLENIWYPVVGILCLSIAWVPEIQSFLLQPSMTSANKKDQNHGVPGHSYSNTQSLHRGVSVDGTRELDNFSVDMTENVTDEPKIIALEKPTWKMVIYMSFLKIVFTFVFSFILLRFAIFDSSVDATAVSEHFKSGWYGWEGFEIYYFIANGCSSLLGYVIGFIACTTCMQKGAYAMPLFLATPLAAVLYSAYESCVGILHPGDSGDMCLLDGTTNILLLVGACLCLVFAQFFSFGYLIIKSRPLIKQDEAQLFWFPTYNPVLLEQWLLLSKRNEHNDETQEDPIERAKRSRVIICTTMYREADYEMRQLLESINLINLAQGESESRRHFESHVFFDGAVKDRNPTDFVLQLVALVQETFGLRPEECCKLITPYGMSMSWKLKGDNGMVFRIHLKDNFKVKNKKRWSQIMYMSYVLDYLMLQHDNANDDDTYILTTDADVRFTPDAVEALLDLMTRDPSVGAVCARTHPLGSGPMVWYQVFEYAIGHWFQKAAEHVIGSVLCSPGCFSVYRCKALRDVVPKYATNVEHAFDFLTKDMGEDRWLCTLMVETGWRIEYCAASENSTHCPEEFEEFYKQRRRWVASTLANMMLLMKEWNIVAKFNHRVSVFFLLYQAVLLFATLIGPSSVILVVSGGLVYGWEISSTTSLVLQILTCLLYVMVCLFASPKAQLNFAKFLTFVYAVVMTSVVVGVAVQVASDFSSGDSPVPVEANTTTTTTENPNLISKDIRVSTTTIYLGVMAGLFLMTGILHLKEGLFLIHGIWYLLCLPSGYLILMLYSICNITDRSWGTREAQTKSVLSTNLTWQDTMKSFYKSFCFCCFSTTTSSSTQTEKQTERPAERPAEREVEGRVRLDSTGDHKPFTKSGDFTGSVETRTVNASTSISIDSRLYPVSEQDQEHIIRDDDDEEVELDSNTVVDVREWLPLDLKDKYAQVFKDNGYDNTMLISGMTEKELKDIGIKTKGTKQKLLQDIQLLPNYEIIAEVPENVSTWLENIGLKQYKANFEREQIRTSKEMEVLKSFGRQEVEKELKITKKGHVKRLLYAIRRLRNPTADERKIIDTRKAIDMAATHHLRRVNVGEHDFWEQLKNKCLLPSSTAFGLEEDLKLRLGDLRNQWLMIFAVSNTLWLILISTLANNGNLLNVFGSNIVGLLVVVLFTFVLIVQFLAMVVHRVGTVTHYLGRAPYRVNEAYHSSWSFNDSDLKASASIEPDEREARWAVKEALKKAQRRIRRPKQKSSETEPLIKYKPTTNGIDIKV